MMITIDKKLFLESVNDEDFSFLKAIYQDKQIQTLALAENNFEVQDANIIRTIEYFKKFR